MRWRTLGRIGGRIHRIGQGGLLAPPIADFTGTPLSGSAPLSVAFTDASTGIITSRLYEKNDGGGWVSFDGFPSAQDPTENLAAGTWSIRETVTNAAGSNTKTRTNYVAVSPPPPPPALAFLAGSDGSQAGVLSLDYSQQIDVSAESRDAVDVHAQLAAILLNDLVFTCTCENDPAKTFSGTITSVVDNVSYFTILVDSISGYGATLNNDDPVTVSTASP